MYGVIARFCALRLASISKLLNSKVFICYCVILHMCVILKHLLRP
jgi:hypothetical protein